MCEAVLVREDRHSFINWGNWCCGAIDNIAILETIYIAVGESDSRCLHYVK